MSNRQEELKKLRRDIHDELLLFANQFAQHHTEDGDDYWWGYDTNLGDMREEFKLFVDKFHKLSAEYRYSGVRRYMQSKFHSPAMLKRLKTALRKEVEDKKVR